MIENNKVVSIEYEVFDEQKKIDGNKGDAPLEFLMGAGQIIVGLEKALADKAKGDSFKVSIQPKDAYGEHQSELIQELPREQFEGLDLKEGMTLFGQSEDGQTAQVIVKGFNDSVVIIDYNHPLAGKTLVFDVKILDVRDATEEEILSGGVGGSCGSGCGCGSGGGHHAHEHSHGGGCCGSGGGCGCGH